MVINTGYKIIRPLHPRKKIVENLFQLFEGDGYQDYGDAKIFRGRLKSQRFVTYNAG
jgi:hypothetical protein